MISQISVFSWKNCQEYFVAKGTFGCICSANQTGRINSGDFFEFHEHFVSPTRYTGEISVILLLNNHQSHLSVKVINFAESPRKVILTFTAHPPINNVLINFSLLSDKSTIHLKNMSSFLVTYECVKNLEKQRLFTTFHKQFVRRYL